jgi:hypothetical protein
MNVEIVDAVCAPRVLIEFAFSIPNFLGEFRMGEFAGEGHMKR